MVYLRKFSWNHVRTCLYGTSESKHFTESRMKVNYEKENWVKPRRSSVFHKSTRLFVE